MGTAASPAVAETCPNEERRIEQGAAGLALPDCRAYELVSPGSALFQESDNDRNRANGSRASLDGNAITYYTTIPAADADSSGYFYLATRGSTGWSVESVAPQSAPGALVEDECEQNVFFSPDLTQSIDEVGWFSGVAKCKSNQDVLDPAEPDLYRNVFVHDIATDTYRLVNVTPPGVAASNARFHDASDDFSRVVFSSSSKLTPEAPSGSSNTFLWADGTVRLVTFLPTGAPVVGQLVEASGLSGFAPLTGAVSVDGRQIFFNASGNLYLRRNADQPQSAVSGGECTEPLLACTKQIDVSQGPGTSGGGIFWRANDDASKVLFTGERKLTPNSTAVSGRSDLYEYDVGSGQLTDLTVNVSEAADVRGIAGTSEDFSHIYFVANGVLAPGASLGKCRGNSSPTQTCSIYLAHEGSIRFVATLGRPDQNVWQEPTTASSLSTNKPREVPASISPNGRFFAFTSIRSLTGYDNRDITTNALNPEIFLYDAAGNEGAGQLSCVSCIPGGARPDDSDVSIQAGDNYGPIDFAKSSWKKNALFDDGRVFFDTTDPLLPEDTNGRRDVYQYQAGQHRLISTGTHGGHSRFFDASPDASNVFFRTPQSLVSSDTDKENVNLYVARVGGGFVEPSPPPPPCEGESCRDAVPAAPAVLLPGTSTFQGPGNPKVQRDGKKSPRCNRAKRRQKKNRCKRGKRRQERSSARTGSGLRRAGK